MTIIEKRIKIKLKNIYSKSGNITDTVSERSIDTPQDTLQDPHLDNFNAAEFNNSNDCSKASSDKFITGAIPSVDEIENAIRQAGLDPVRWAIVEITDFDCTILANGVEK